MSLSLDSLFDTIINVHWSNPVTPFFSVGVQPGIPIPVFSGGFQFDSGVDSGSPPPNPNFPAGFSVAIGYISSFTVPLHKVSSTTLGGFTQTGIPPVILSGDESAFGAWEWESFKGVQGVPVTGPPLIINKKPVPGVVNTRSFKVDYLATPILESGLFSFFWPGPYGITFPFTTNWVSAFVGVAPTSPPTQLMFEATITAEPTTFHFSPPGQPSTSWKAAGLYAATGSTSQQVYCVPA